MDYPLERFSKIDTPFYYYDLSLLKRTLQTVNDILKDHPNFHVHYAVKANANKRLLNVISAAGFGADCVSGGEVLLANQNGFPAEKIVFAGVGKSDKEIREALAIGIFCFNVESIQELEVINEIASNMGKIARVAFRINPNVDAHTHEKITTGLNENKFGIAMDDAIPAILLCRNLKNVEYVGLHFHIGSQILYLNVFEDLCRQINEIQSELKRYGIVAQFINVGGGLGIDYHNPDKTPVADFVGYFSVFANKLDLYEGQSLHFELGRSIVGQCGSLISRTLYIKEGKTKKFVIVDAGFTDLIRPAMYGAFHSIENISNPADENKEKYDVVGPICESSDVFIQNYVLPLTKRGDLIAFRSAGAYGEVMASTYNCRQLPKALYSE